MTLDELLNTDSQHTTIPPREEHVQATIAAARASFVRAESEMPMATHTFLRIQLALIHKRWWLAQALVLALVWWALPQMADNLLIARSLGLTASLFVILLIPELAKNRTYQCMEIESTTHYTLRHIYAARLMLFGGVDLVILTGFCGALTLALQLSLATLVTQFLLPLVTTACLCFAVLSSPRAAQGTVAICACLFWSGVWWLIVANDGLYSQIALPLWFVLFALSLLALAIFARRYLKHATEQWEGQPHGTLYD